MITIFNRSTWRPMAVTALKTNIVSYHQRDSNNKRNSLYPDTNVMSRSFFLYKRHSLHDVPKSHDFLYKSTT
jgi:hypothetical protein